jgi:hypothetical protein
VEVIRGETYGERPRPALPPTGLSADERLADSVLGVAWGVARLGKRAAQLAGRAASPVVDVLMDPPLVPTALRPITRIDALARRWRQDRPVLAGTVVQVGQTATPLAVERFARVIDLDQVLANIVSQLDLTALADRILAGLDLNATSRAALARLDVDAVAAEVIDKLDVTAAVSRVIQQLDTVAMVDRVMDELPTDELARVVIAHLDVETIVATALDEVDLTALVLERVDLGAIVDAAVAQVDITAMVVDRVDLGAVVSSALDQLDLTEIVLKRVDLNRVATTVMDEIDLPTILQESTGSMASETIREVRMTSVEADRAVARIVDRFTFRRKPRKLDAPGDPDSITALVAIAEHAKGLESSGTSDTTDTPK